MFLWTEQAISLTKHAQALLDGAITSADVRRAAESGNTMLLAALVDTEASAAFHAVLLVAAYQSFTRMAFFDESSWAKERSRLK